MPISVLANLGFAGGAGVVAPSTLGDLTTLFTRYVETLQDVAGGSGDSNTLVDIDEPVVIAATPGEVDDLNTLYARYLS